MSVAMTWLWPKTLLIVGHVKPDVLGKPVDVLVSLSWQTSSSATAARGETATCHMMHV